MNFFKLMFIFSILMIFKTSHSGANTVICPVVNMRKRMTCEAQIHKQCKGGEKCEEIIKKCCNKMYERMKQA
ncbi:UNVERIFIED_CONTAM: hypothetical protein RMT77_019620 [Armadillidium vulgare]